MRTKNVNSRYLYYLSCLLFILAAETFAQDAQSPTTFSPVVMINAVGRTSYGSGVLLNNRVVLTSSHVVGDATEMLVTFPDRAHPHHTTTVTEYYIEDHDHDIILLALPEDGQESFDVNFPEPIGASEDLISEALRVTGFPEEDSGVVKWKGVGVVIRGLRSVRPASEDSGVATFYWVLDAKSDKPSAWPKSGNSGGPLWDPKSRDVYGIVTNASRSRSFAVSSDIILDLLDRMPDEPKSLKIRLENERVIAESVARVMDGYLEKNDYAGALEYYKDRYDTTAAEPKDSYFCSFALARTYFGLGESGTACEHFVDALRFGKGKLIGEIQRENVVVRLARAEFKKIIQDFSELNPEPRGTADRYEVPLLDEDRIHANRQRVEKLLEPDSLTTYPRKRLLILRAGYAAIQRDEATFAECWEELQPFFRDIIDRARENFASRLQGGRINSNFAWLFPDTMEFSAANRARVVVFVASMYRPFFQLHAAASAVVVESVAEHGNTARAHELMKLLEMDRQVKTFEEDEVFMRDLIRVRRLRDLFTNS